MCFHSEGIVVSFHTSINSVASHCSHWRSDLRFHTDSEDEPLHTGSDDIPLHLYVGRHDVATSYRLLRCSCTPVHIKNDPSKVKQGKSV